MTCDGGDDAAASLRRTSSQQNTGLAGGPAQQKLGHLAWDIDPIPPMRHTSSATNDGERRS